MRILMIVLQPLLNKSERFLHEGSSFGQFENGATLRMRTARTLLAAVATKKKSR